MSLFVGNRVRIIGGTYVGATGEIRGFRLTTVIVALGSGRGVVEVLRRNVEATR